MKRRPRQDEIRAWLELGFWAARQTLFLVWLSAGTALAIADVASGAFEPTAWLLHRSFDPYGFGPY